DYYCSTWDRRLSTLF
nr:immunoglobulin light chain junction region [Macaca mulatta]